jgi:acyl carrier protein
MSEATDHRVLRERIRRTLHDQLGDIMAEVPDDALLPEALGSRYDSLAAMECITRVEEEFGIEVDFVAHDVRYSFSSIDRIARFTAERLEDMAVIGGER